MNNGLYQDTRHTEWTVVLGVWLGYSDNRFSISAFFVGVVHTGKKITSETWSQLRDVDAKDFLLSV